MLVLARQLHERIIMPAVGATIEVVAIKPNSVRLGIEAPPEIVILREEVFRRGGAAAEELSARLESSMEDRLDRLKQILRNRLSNVALGLDLLRQQLGRRDDPTLEGLLQRMSAEVHLLDNQLRALLNDPREQKTSGHLSFVDGASRCSLADR
jgi:carbon storage regulator CsrA